jgi:hypothetical protein
MAKFDLKRIAKSYFQLPFPALGVFNGVAFTGSIIKTVKGILKKSEFNGEDVFPVVLDGWDIPDEPTISIQGGNDLVITKLNRGKRVAHVIEEINRENMVINMRGTIFCKYEDEYPAEDVGKLRNILAKGKALDIECDLLTYFNITRVVVVDWKMNEGEGRPMEQDYTIKFIEDIPVELELIDNE